MPGHPRPDGLDSWDAFGASVTEAEYLDNARILAERFLPLGYDVVTVDIQWYEAGAKSSWYRGFAPLVLGAHAIDATGRPMVLSLSPGPAHLDQSAHLQRGRPRRARHPFHA